MATVLSVAVLSSDPEGSLTSSGGIACAMTGGSCAMVACIMYADLMNVRRETKMGTTQIPRQPTFFQMCHQVQVWVLEEAAHDDENGLTGVCL